MSGPAHSRIQKATKCTVTCLTSYQSLTTKQSFINEPFIKEIIIMNNELFEKTNENLIILLC